MNQVFILFSIISYCIGFIALVLSIAFYYKWKNKLFLYLFILEASLTLMLFEGTVQAYFSEKNIDLFIDLFLINFDTLGCIGIIFSAPAIYYNLSGRDGAGFTRFIFNGMALLLIIIIPVLFTLQPFLFTPNILKDILYSLSKTADVIALFTFMLFSISMLFKLGTIENESVRKYVRAIIILFYILFPGLFIDSFPALYRAVYVEKLHLPEGFAASSIIYFFGNLVSLFYFRKFIISRFGIKDEHYIPDSFVRNFGITDREKEIILFLLKNYNYNEISVNLLISKRTVEKHIHNIYKKININNRDKLLLLLKTDNAHH